MKRKYIYISSFLIIATVFSLVFSYSYKTTRDKYNLLEQEKKKQSTQVDTVKEDKITDKTEYILEILQVSSDQVTSQNETIPAEFAGKTRAELSAYLESYMKELPLEESLKGLIDFELVSFSKEKILLRKTYQDLAAENKFYLTAVDGEVVVYYNDKKTVYEYTGIMTEHLSADEIAMLTIGYFVEGEEQLFGILENYSS